MKYIAQLTKDGRRTMITFPDCPGCWTFAAINPALALRLTLRSARQA